MEKRKVIRRRIRKDKRIKRSIATFMMVIMLMAASISAVAFAVSSDYEADAVDYTEEAYVSAPVAEEVVDADEVAVEDAAEAAEPALDEVADDTYEAAADEVSALDAVTEENAESDYIEIEPLAGVDPSEHTVAILAGATPDDAADTGFATLGEALAAASPGDTIYFLGNVTHNAIVDIDKSLTLDFQGYNLTTQEIIVDSGVSFTVIGGGTLYTTLDGVYVSGNSVVNVSANIVAGSDGVVVSGSGATVTINGNVSGSDAIVSQVGSNSTIVVNGNVSGTLCGIHAYGGGTITVIGNVVADDVGITADLGSTATVNVTGSVTADFTGIRASANSTVNLTGDINVPVIGIDAKDNAQVHVTGNVVLSAEDSIGVLIDGSAEVRITGALTAVYYIVAGADFLAATDHDATSTLEGYRQFSPGNATVWVLGAAQGGGPTPPVPPAETIRVQMIIHIDGVPTGEPLYFDFPADYFGYGWAEYPPFLEWLADLIETYEAQGFDFAWLDWFESDDEAGYVVLERLHFYFESGTQAPPAGTPSTPGDSAEATPTPPAAGTGSTDTTPSADRRPAAGPQTGDTINWFTQTAVIAALIASFAAAGIYRTRREQS